MSDPSHNAAGREAVDRELFDRIRRTQELAAPFPGVDSSAVARKAVEAYWRERAVERADPGPELARETALLLRGSAASLEGLWPEFWRGFWVSILPVAAALATVWLPTRLGFLPPIWIPVCGVLGSTVVALVIFYRTRQLDRVELLATGRALASGRPSASGPALASGHWFALRNSLGALAGGLILAAIVGTGSYGQAMKTIDLAVALAEDRLGKLAMSSLVATQGAGRFRPAAVERTFEVKALAASLFNRSRELLSVTTDSMSEREAVYRACAPGVPGALVLQLKPTAGELVWQNAGEVHVRDRFVLARVERSEGASVDLVAGDGERLHLSLDGPPAIPLAAGQCLVAAFNAETLQVKELQAVEC